MAETTYEAGTYTASGAARERMALPPDLFDGTVNVPVMHQAVKAYLGNQRQGNASTKIRKYVVGGNQKPWRQKGTGRARAGSTRAPHWVGGGMAFPTVMRSFETKVNRKVARAALRGALAAHAKDGSVGIVDGSAFTEPSTKQAVAFLEGWGRPRPLVLVVADGEDVIAKSFRNLEDVSVTVPSELEVNQLVRARSLLISEPALDDVQGRAR